MVLNPHHVIRPWTSYIISTLIWDLLVDMSEQQSMNGMGKARQYYPYTANTKWWQPVRMTELLLDVWMFSFSFLSFFLFFPVAGKHDGFKYTGEVTGGKDLKVQYVLPYLTVFSIIEAPGLRQGLGGFFFSNKCTKFQNKHDKERAD